MTGVASVGHLGTGVGLGTHACGLNVMATVLGPTLARRVHVPDNVNVRKGIGVSKAGCTAELTLARNGKDVGISTTVSTGAHESNDVSVGHLTCRTGLRTQRVRTRRFLPRRGLCAFAKRMRTGNINASFLSPQAQLVTGTGIGRMRCSGCRLRGVITSTRITGNEVRTGLSDEGRLLGNGVTISTLTDAGGLRTALITSIHRTSVCRLGVASGPISISLYNRVSILSSLGSDRGM